MTNLILRVIIYIRVSTKMQEEKFSLKAQTLELRRYAEQMGWKLVAEYKDVETGGKLNKKGLNALLDDVEEGKVDVVLCIDQDRLSRLDTVAWEFLKSTLRDNGVKIAEPGNITDLDNEDDEFISDIKNLIAKREKRAIVRRMMRGKRQRTREGKGWGKAPIEYNYDKNTSTYSINEKWSWLIPYIDELYLEKGLSDHKIAKELNKLGPTPNGKQWSDVNIRQKLTNETYCGRLIKSFSNGETIVVENVFPILRTDERHQKILEKRKSKFRRKPASTTQLLRKVNMQCAYCGNRLGLHMSGLTKYGIHFYITHNQPKLRQKGSKCFFSINTLRVDKNVAKAVKSIIQGEEFAKRYIQLDFDKVDLLHLEKELKNLSKLKSEVRSKIDRLLPLYLDGGWSKDQLDQQKKLLENELKLHEDREVSLSNKHELVKSNLFNYDMVLQYLAIAEHFDVMLDGEAQMALIGSLFPRAIVYEDNIMLYGTLPNNAPIEVRVPLDPNPIRGVSGSLIENDPKSRHKQVQKYFNEYPKATFKETASYFGFSESTLYKLQQEFGDFVRQKSKNNCDPLNKYLEIKSYLEHHPNATHRQIAEATGISKSSVGRIRLMNGL